MSGVDAAATRFGFEDLAQDKGHRKAISLALPSREANARAKKVSTAAGEAKK